MAVTYPPLKLNEQLLNYCEILGFLPAAQSSLGEHSSVIFEKQILQFQSIFLLFVFFDTSKSLIFQMF